MSQARFGVAIVADDQTAKGVKSAEKRISAIPKHTSVAQKAQMQGIQAAATRSSAGIVKSFSRVEQAASRAFGGRSPVSAAIGRLSAVGAAGAEAGEGMMMAVRTGGLLMSTLGPVGIAAAATAAVIGAVAAATDKMVSGWAKGIGGAKRLADTVGISTQALQKFQGAGERLGLDSNTSGGALAGLAQTLDDARYGRNGSALAVLAKMRVSMRTKADGTADTEAMLPDIADAIARQNSAGRRTAASALGIPLEALPLFTQGSGALSADMADVGKIGAVASASQISQAMRWQRKRSIVGQMAQRASMAAGGWAEDQAEPMLDGAERAGRGTIGALSGNRSFSNVVREQFAPAASVINRAAGTMDRAASRIAGGIVGRADAAPLGGIVTRAGRPGTFHATQAVLDAIHRGAAISGVSETMMRSIAAQESGFDPANWPGKSGGHPYGWQGQHALGLFQFVPQTWLGAIKQHGAKYGLHHEVAAITGSPGRYTVRDKRALAAILSARTNPFLATAMTGELMNDAAPGVARAAGHREATPGDLYLQHFLGPAKARRFLAMERADPHGAATAALPTEARVPGNAGLFYNHGRPNNMEQLLNLLIEKASRPIRLEVIAAPGTTIKTTSPGGGVNISHSPVGR